MQPDKPFNLDLMSLTYERLRGRVGQVKVSDVFDGITENFHDEGLFSTTIFGQVGSEDRDRLFGYIKLNTKIFNPVIYNRLKKLKRLYDEIMMGTRYAVFDDTLMDFVPSTPLEGDTGYSFFMKYWPKLKLRKNKSARRNIMIDIIHQNADKIFLEYYLVIPAGLRDLFIDKHGKKSEDEINEMYRRMISISNSLEMISGSGAEGMDVARRNIQRIANEIYEYLENIITGKKGFAQAKWGSRTVFNGTRNVLSPMDTSAEVLDGIRAVSCDDTHVGLFQTLKGILPLAVYLIKNHPFYQASFTGDPEYVYLINKETLHRGQVKSDTWIHDTWQSIEGIEKTIDKFGDDTFKNRYISISDHYLGLLYVDQEKFMCLNDIDELPEGWNVDNVKPVTFLEYFYICGYHRFYDIRATNTRYPVAGQGSIYPTRIYVKTVMTAKALKEVTVDENGEIKEIGLAREYPFIPTGSEPRYFNSMAVHSSRLSGLGGDLSPSK